MKRFLFLLPLILFFTCDKKDPVSPDNDVPVVRKYTVSTTPSTDDPNYFDLTCDIEPLQTDNFKSSSFRAKIPKNDKPVKGILVLSPGIQEDGTADGTQLVEEQEWIDFATKHNFAMVGIKFRVVDSVDDWNDHTYIAQSGSGYAFNEALKVFFNETKVMNFYKLPLIMWGYSWGGAFNYHFSLKWSQQVVCLASVKSGYAYDAYYGTQIASKSPCILFYGENEDETHKLSISGVFKNQRNNSALWCIAGEVGAGHELGNTSKIAKPFMASVIEKRIPENLGDYSDLVAIEESSGWLGNVEDFTISPYQSFEGDKSKASWLPDESVAKNWQLFVQGKISEMTP